MRWVWLIIAAACALGVLALALWPAGARRLRAWRRLAGKLGLRMSEEADGWAMRGVGQDVFIAITMSERAAHEDGGGDGDLKLAWTPDAPQTLPPGQSVRWARGPHEDLGAYHLRCGWLEVSGRAEPRVAATLWRALCPAMPPSLWHHGEGDEVILRRCEVRDGSLMAAFAVAVEPPEQGASFWHQSLPTRLADEGARAVVAWRRQPQPPEAVAAALVSCRRGDAPLALRAAALAALTTRAAEDPAAATTRDALLQRAATTPSPEALATWWIAAPEAARALDLSTDALHDALLTARDAHDTEAAAALRALLLARHPDDAPWHEALPLSARQELLRDAWRAPDASPDALALGVATRVHPMHDLLTMLGLTLGESGGPDALARLPEGPRARLERRLLDHLPDAPRREQERILQTLAHVGRQPALDALARAEDLELWPHAALAVMATNAAQAILAREAARL